MSHPTATTPAPAEEFAGLADEFPAAPAPPTVQRRWVTTTTGGHVSGVFWHTRTPGLLLLHDAGAGARAWDALLLALGRPAVSVDLPGHGRSSRRDSGDYRPKRLAAAVADAAHSFAPAGVPVLAHGLGALTAIAVTAKKPGQLGRLLLLDTVPGALGGPWPATSPDFADTEEARDWLAARGGADAGRTALLETVREPDGRLAWRHHLASLPETAPTDLDDESLWARLAAAPDPVLIRTKGGPLTEAHADRFRADVPGGETVAVEEGPEALATLLTTLLA